MKLTILLMGFCQGRRWEGCAGVSNGCSLSCKRFLAHPVPWVSQSTRKPWTPSVLAPLGSAALAGLCGGGYLGALLGPPPYLVSLRANSLAQPEGTECLSPSPACGRVLSMNRTPGEQWLLEQADRFNDGPPTASLDAVWLPDPRLLPQAVTNPVVRPLGASFPEWFDV